MVRYRRMLYVGAAIIITGFSNCTPDKKPAKEGETADIVKARTEAPAEKKPEPPPAVNTGYKAYPLKGVDTAVKAFNKQYSPGEQWIILALNRLDKSNIKRADTLIIPDTLSGDLLFYSPFPQQVSMLEPVNKIVIFSYAIQAFAAYEKGRLVYWGPTSMGAKIHPTPTGLHFSNWKAKETISTVDDEWKLKWNFNIENKEGVGWHQYAMPGYPASHSCLRMLEEQAKWMYTWADQWILEGTNTVLAQGTPVVVYGAYPFGSRRPWRNMLEDPAANKITTKDLEQELQPFMERILQQQQRRDGVLAARQQSGVKPS